MAAVDGGLSLGEDFVATPAKAAASRRQMINSRRGPQTGDGNAKTRRNQRSVRNGSGPLDKTISGIDTAAQLLDSGKYYEGNQALKGVEDGLRLDVADVSSGPDKASSTSDKTAPTLAAPNLEILRLPRDAANK